MSISTPEAKNTLYLKIKEALKHQIRIGKLSTGDRIMSETEICSSFGVSRISAKRALDELEKEGYIARFQGKGSFVTYTPIEHMVMGLYSFNDEMRKQGLTPSTKILDFKEVQVGDLDDNTRFEIKSRMYLQDHDSLYYIRRFRYANGNLIFLDNSYLSTIFCPCILPEDLTHYEDLDSLMQNKFRLNVTRGQEFLFAGAVSAEEADLLSVNVGAPALKILRINYAMGNPVEFDYRISRGETYRYRIDLQKRT